MLKCATKIQIKSILAEEIVRLSLYSTQNIQSIYRAPEGGVQNRVSNFQIQEYPISIFSCCEYRTFGKSVSEIETQYRISIFFKANIANLRSISNIGFSKSSISGIGNYPFRGPIIIKVLL